jgi:hypothetical protein
MWERRRTWACREEEVLVEGLRGNGAAQVAGRSGDPLSCEWRWGIAPLLRRTSSSFSISMVWTAPGRRRVPIDDLWQPRVR